jgi:hypothetical protein
MAILDRIQVGAFSSPLGTGSQTIPVGFAPKGVFFWLAVADTASNAYGYGAATSAGQQWSVSISSAQNTVPPAVSKRWGSSSHCIYLPRGDTNVLFRSAQFVSFDGEGFTVNWDFNGEPSTDNVIYYCAFGDGVSTIDARAGTFSAGGSTGSTAVTGLGFQPNALIVCHQLSSSFGNTDDCAMGHGFATGAAATYAQYAFDKSAVNPTEVLLIDRDDAIATAFDGTTAYRLALQSFDAGGFTVNCVTALSSIQHGYLALRLPNAAAAARTSPTVGGNEVISTGFNPTAVLFNSFGNVAAQGGSSILNLRHGYGGANDTLQLAVSGYTTDNVAIHSSRLHNHTTQVIEAHGIPGNTNPTQLDAQRLSLDANGFTLQWGVVQNPGWRYGYLAVRSVQVAPTGHLLPLSGAGLS